jgi:hypothetical protein
MTRMAEKLCAFQVGVLSGLFTATEWEARKCVYCCYDAFSRLDIHCCMSSPGGVHAYARDGSGHKCVPIA